MFFSSDHITKKMYLFLYKWTLGQIEDQTVVLKNNVMRSKCSFLPLDANIHLIHLLKIKYHLII